LKNKESGCAELFWFKFFSNSGLIRIEFFRSVNVKKGIQAFTNKARTFSEQYCSNSFELDIQVDSRINTMFN